MINDVIRKYYEIDVKKGNVHITTEEREVLNEIELLEGIDEAALVWYTWKKDPMLEKLRKDEF